MVHEWDRVHKRLFQLLCWAVIFFGLAGATWMISCGREAVDIKHGFQQNSRLPASWDGLSDWQGSQWSVE